MYGLRSILKGSKLLFHKRLLQADKHRLCNDTNMKE